MWYGLRGGEWVPLPKDCGCLPSIHEGPHWLHADWLWAEANRRLLERQDALAPHAFAQEELPRLREKRFQMESRGLEAVREGTP